MSFNLIKKGTGRINTVFHVTNSAGDLCGSINVHNEEVPNFLSCWIGPSKEPQPRAAQQSSTNAMAAAFLAHRRKFSQAAILRS